MVVTGFFVLCLIEHMRHNTAVAAGNSSRQLNVVSLKQCLLLYLLHHTAKEGDCHKMYFFYYYCILAYIQNHRTNNY